MPPFRRFRLQSIPLVSPSTKPVFTIPLANNPAGLLPILLVGSPNGNLLRGLEGGGALICWPLIRRTLICRTLICRALIRWNLTCGTLICACSVAGRPVFQSVFPSLSYNAPRYCHPVS